MGLFDKKHSVGKTIAALRKEKGWTQVELAEKLQVSDKAVSKWEKDESSPSVEFFPALAELFGVSIDYLMTGKKAEPEIIAISKNELCAKKDDVKLFESLSDMVLKRNDDYPFSFNFNSQIAQDSLEVRLSLYENIGFFIEIAQMLEYNLRKLICYERSVKEIESGDITKDNVEKICNYYDQYYDKTFKEKWTLGKLKKELKVQSSFFPEILDFFDKINDYRVLLVHKIFQINIKINNLSSADTVQKYLQSRLIPMTNKALATNDLIIKTIRLYQSDLHAYKKQVGIPLPADETHL